MRLPLRDRRDVSLFRAVGIRGQKSEQVLDSSVWFSKPFPRRRPGPICGRPPACKSFPGVCGSDRLRSYVRYQRPDGRRRVGLREVSFQTLRRRWTPMDPTECLASFDRLIAPSPGSLASSDFWHLLLGVRQTSMISFFVRSRAVSSSRPRISRGAARSCGQDGPRTGSPPWRRASGLDGSEHSARLLGSGEALSGSSGGLLELCGAGLR